MPIKAIKSCLLIFLAWAFLCWPCLAIEVAAQAQSQPTLTTSDTPSKPISPSWFKGFELELGKSLHAFHDFWTKYRADVKRVSEVSQQIRNERFVPISGFAFFLIFLAPRKVANIRLFFNQMMEKHPLPAYRQGGVTDDEIAQARKVLFFFCLYFVYQIVQFPLTIKNHDGIAFFADLIFQVVIVGFLLSGYFRLQHLMSERWENDAERHEAMMKWLNTKLEGMQIKWGELRRITVGIFFVSFSPYFFAHVFGWLDALSNTGDRLAVYLANS